MGARIASIAALIIGGVIIADVLTHAEGTKAALGKTGVGGLWSGSLNALLGKAS
jgi:hypothetical protein